jgi:hypothetical protein
MRVRVAAGGCTWTKEQWQSLSHIEQDIYMHLLFNSAGPNERARSVETIQAICFREAPPSEKYRVLICRLFGAETSLPGAQLRSPRQDGSCNSPDLRIVHAVSRLATGAISRL